MYTHLSLSLYIYIYMYTYMHTYIHIYYEANQNAEHPHVQGSRVKQLWNSVCLGKSTQGLVIHIYI